jgi:hypothetical protein
MLNNNHGQNDHGNGPRRPDTANHIAELEAIADDPELLKLAAQVEGAIAFVHFDPSTAESHTVEALVHSSDLTKVHRGLYVHIISLKDNRHYSGRIVEGPFYNPDALKRDSTPVQFIILNQGQGKVLAVPEYHGWVKIEILGEEREGNLGGAVRRPHPASPIKPYDTALMEQMLQLGGDMVIGQLDNYPDVLVRIDSQDKNIVPRNWLTVGTVGSGKSNTDQVFIEETLRAGYAQVVIDPEGEYVSMDEPSQAANVGEALEAYDRHLQGVEHITVYCPPGAQSKRQGATHFSVQFSSLSPEVIAELVGMNSAQQMRFTFLYDQAVQVLRKEQGKQTSLGSDDWDVSRGYVGVTLKLLLSMLDDELDYYNNKRSAKKDDNNKKDSNSTTHLVPLTPQTYFHQWAIPPLINDHQDVVSYGALRKKLRELNMSKIFDVDGVSPLDMKRLSEPGHLSVIDMSDAGDQQVVNIVIADLLAQMYRYKMSLSEEDNVKRKVVLTIEEAHGFVSREKQDKMEQTLDQLRRIARRGRKRWLVLHFVTQSPQHLPSELFELAVNKIIHQTTGTENLRVLKAAAGAVNESIWKDVPTLGRGRAVFVSDKYPHPILVRVRPAASKRNYMA